MMAVLRLKYVHSFVDKTGRVRYYFRYQGKRVKVPGQPGDAEFTAEYDALLRAIKAEQQQDENNVAFGPGTLGQVIETYLASDEFARKADSSKAVYRKLLDELKGIVGRALIVDMREKHIRDIRRR